MLTLLHIIKQVCNVFSFYLFRLPFLIIFNDYGSSSIIAYQSMKCINDSCHFILAVYL